MALLEGSTCIAFCASRGAASENKRAARGANFEEEQLIISEIVAHGGALIAEVCKEDVRRPMPL